MRLITMWRIFLTVGIIQFGAHQAHAQENYNANLLKTANQMSLEDLQVKIDSLPDPGILGTAFTVKCRNAPIPELDSAFKRAKFGSHSYDYIFSMFMQRGVIPTKRYSMQQIEWFLANILPTDSRRGLFLSTYRERLKALPDATLASVFKSAPLQSEISLEAFREIENRKMAGRAAEQETSGVFDPDRCMRIIDVSLNNRWPFENKKEKRKNLVIRFHVDDAAGNVSGISLVQSCGVPRLDEQALEVVRTTAPFQFPTFKQFTPFSLEYSFTSRRYR